MMHRTLRLFSILIILSLLSGNLAFTPTAANSALSSTPSPQQPWKEKVDALVLSQATSGSVEFLIYMADQADLSGADDLKTKQEKTLFVYQKLTEAAQRSQPPLIQALSARGAQYRPFWITNVIWARGDLALIQSIASRPDVWHVYANPQVHLQEPLQPPDAPLLAESANSSPETIEWNIAKVNAPKVWASGYTGQGVVIAGADTGYWWEHPALKNHYRGWDGTAVNNNYSWHDAIHAGGGACGPDSPEPCDDYNHGTHTMGIMVGDDGNGKQIGMAPGAKWIGCRNMDVGTGSPVTYTECFQFFLAPTDLNNNNPRPELAPDVINNSWGCPQYENCTTPNILLNIVDTLKAAGIVVVSSAGNNGSTCGSVNEPIAIYPSAFSVGATNSSDIIASFSSRGPVVVDSSYRLKPDISAPGVNILSSICARGMSGQCDTSPSSLYGNMNGTSMAAPHVTGLVALLISARPDLRGHVDEIIRTIEQTAVPRISTQDCPSDIPGSGGQVPNNIYGWGRIDAKQALLAIQPALTISLTASAPAIASGQSLTYTFSVKNQDPISIAHQLILTDVLPAHTVLVDSSVPYSLTGRTIRWSLSSLKPGTVWPVNLSVRVPLTYTGSILNDQYLINALGFKQVTGPAVTTQVFAMDLKKTASLFRVKPGMEITFTFTVTNLHLTATLHKLVLINELPVGAVFDGCTQECIITGTTITWQLAQLDPGASITVQLGVRVKPSAGSFIIDGPFQINSQEIYPAVQDSPLFIPVDHFFFFPEIYSNY